MAMSSTFASTSEALSLQVDGPASGAENMRRDLELLRRCAAGLIAGAVRLYWFAPPCLSLGRLQPDDDIDADACKRDGIDVVRRPSGGRAVLHDNEVTYAVVCRVDDPDLGGAVLDACSRIHEAVGLGLAAIGIDTVPRERGTAVRSDAVAGAQVSDCFAHPGAHELLDRDGHKLVGSAQARLGQALLQHGSVMLEPPHASRYLRRSPGPASPPTFGVRRLTGRPVTHEELVAALAGGFSRTLGDRLVGPLDTT
jgi:lipoyl(octanoyl) transferase